ncbi:MAG: hypothetical protein PUB85_05310 [Clostridia bacterium]|nr:hypothetical protein [Clostridia bacterium]
MRRTKRSGSFFLCLLFNMLLNLEGTIPAWILLALHFWRGWSLLWFFLALALWVIYLIVWMRIIGWAGRCGSTPDPPKENKNPYSSGKRPE